MDCITKVHDLDRKKTIMIGDRLDTDVSVLKSVVFRWNTNWHELPDPFWHQRWNRLDDGLDG